MSKSSPEFLARLESRSREKQTRFMQNIARRLGRETASAPDPHRFQGAPEYWNEYDLSESDRVRVFMENWRKVGGEAERVRHDGRGKGIYGRQGEGNEGETYASS